VLSKCQGHDTVFLGLLERLIGISRITYHVVEPGWTYKKTRHDLGSNVHIVCTVCAISSVWNVNMISGAESETGLHHHKLL
jgi:hypothetical protein